MTVSLLEWTADASPAAADARLRPPGRRYFTRAVRPARRTHAAALDAETRRPGENETSAGTRSACLPLLAVRPGGGFVRNASSPTGRTSNGRDQDWTARIVHCCG